MRFADEIVLIAKSPEELEQLIVSEVDLKINYNKTKIIYNEMVESTNITITFVTLQVEKE